MDELRFILYSMFNALSVKTLKSYLSCVRRFLVWKDKVFPEESFLPSSPFPLLMFLSVQTHYVGSTTLDSFLAAFSWAYCFCGFNDVTKHSCVSYALRGFKKLVAKVPERKNPLKREVLVCIVEKWVRADSSLIELRNAAMLVCCFYAFFRINEILNLRLSDVSFGPNFEYVCFAIPVHKTCQLRNSDKVLLAKTGKIDCPVTILLRYMKTAFASKILCSDFLFQALSPLRGKFFALSGKRMTYDLARKVLFAGLRAVGINTKGYGTHSLRAGACTAAALAGVSDRLLTLHGRWRCSSSKDRYVLDNMKARLSVSQAVAKT
jgi:hypothetical protein